MSKLIDSQQCTILFHVDDLKISYNNLEVVDGVLVMSGSVFGYLAVSNEKDYTYFGINLDHSMSRKVTASIVKYFKSMIG